MKSHFFIRIKAQLIKKNNTKEITLTQTVTDRQFFSYLEKHTQPQKRPFYGAGNEQLVMPEGGGEEQNADRPTSPTPYTHTSAHTHTAYRASPNDPFM